MSPPGSVKNKSSLNILGKKFEESIYVLEKQHTSQLWFSISAQGTNATCPSIEGNRTCMVQKNMNDMCQQTTICVNYETTQPSNQN